MYSNNESINFKTSNKNEEKKREAKNWTPFECAVLAYHIFVTQCGEFALNDAAANHLCK